MDNEATTVNADKFDLPAELISQIFTYLDSTDVFNTRLACKKFDEGSFGHFGKRFFRKRGFLITSSSLGILQQIAAHEQLRKYVQHVWFNPDCYTGVRLQQMRDEVASDTSDEFDKLWEPLTEKQYCIYKSCVRDHRNLLVTETLQHTLHVAFSNLPNLKTVGMRRSEDHNPYGSNTLYRMVGVDPRILGPARPKGAGRELSAATMLFAAILKALENTPVRLQRLYTDAIGLDHLDPGFLTLQTIQSVCQSILYLELNVHRMQDVRGSQGGVAVSASDPSRWGRGLINLLNTMPGLLEIGLQIFANYKQHHLMAPAPGDPSTWRESYPFNAFANFTNAVSFPCLQRIKLEKLTTTSHDLWNFLEPSAHVMQSLKLRDIRLLSSIDESRPWQPVLSKLSAMCPALSYILLYHLMHDHGGVSFVEHEPDPPSADTVDFLVDHVPVSHGGRQAFMKYEHIAIEAQSREEVRLELGKVAQRHWYQKPLFSYAMDEKVWHTDTSDEEW